MRCAKFVNECFSAHILVIKISSYYTIFFRILDTFIHLSTHATLFNYAVLVDYFLILYLALDVIFIPKYSAPSFCSSSAPLRLIHTYL